MRRYLRFKWSQGDSNSWPPACHAGAFWLKTIGTTKGEQRFLFFRAVSRAESPWWLFVPVPVRKNEAALDQELCLNLFSIKSNTKRDHNSDKANTRPTQKVNLLNKDKSNIEHCWTIRLDQIKSTGKGCWQTGGKEVHFFYRERIVFGPRTTQQASQGLWDSSNSCFDLMKLLPLYPGQYIENETVRLICMAGLQS